MGDRLLVVCDGVVERITNKEVAKYVHAKCKHVKDDPAEVMRELLLYSLARGSTDNQSAILVCFEDGTGYSSSDTFIAGPLSEYASDRRFVTPTSRTPRLGDRMPKVYVHKLPKPIGRCQRTGGKLQSQARWALQSFLFCCSCFYLRSCHT